MAVQVEEFNSNLNKLLSDICKFLTDKSNYEQLSPIARKKADELIGRSKQQLQTIAKIGIDGGFYVDMNQKVSIAESDADDEDYLYSLIETPPVLPTIVIDEPNPFANLPAKELCQDVKYGYLSWRCKFILKFEKNRRIYAGIHHNWFLVYSSEKDSKPIHSFNLKFHKAQIVTPKQIKNPPQDFELICTSEEKKTYYFLASTHKDVLQWTTQINRCYNNFNTQNTPENKSSDDDEEDSIYQEPAIKTFVPHGDQNKTVNEPPDLPARRCLKSSTLPPLPNMLEPQSISGESVDSSDSFSSDDEDDTIYDIPCFQTS